jgi:hypothetical protein
MRNISLSPPTSTEPEQLRVTLRPLSRAAARVFSSLVDGLGAGDAKKVDNASGAFMAVSVDCLVGGSNGPALYAVAHRYELNGDLVPDPDVEFYVVDDPRNPGAKAIYPTAIDHGALGYYRHVQLDGALNLIRVAAKGQAALARFCDDWMSNIAAQQRLVLS